MSVRFDAASDRLSYSLSAPPTPNSGFTVTMWAYVSVSRGDYSTLVRLWTASDSNVPLTFDTDSNGLNGPHYFTTAGIVNGSLNMAVGSWRKLAVSRGAGGTGHNYAALSTGSTTVTSGAIGSIADPIGITLAGRTPAESNEWFNGRLTYVRVWSRELSQAEIEAEWASTTPVSTTGLWADWPLETAADLTDHSGGGHTLVADASEGATAVTTEDGPLPVVYVKTGGGASVRVGIGAKAVTSATVYTKTGGAAASGVGVGAEAVVSATVYSKAGGAASGAVGVGAKTVTPATTYTKTGGAVVVGAGSGAATVTSAGVVYVKTGGAVAHGVGTGVRALVIIKFGGSVAHCVGGSLRIFPPVPTNWPPVITGPSVAPLVLVSGPKDAPLILVAAPVAAPLVLVSGPQSTSGSGASELPLMSRRGLSRRSLPAEADEFVVAQFRALRERRRAAKIRRANP